MLISPRGSASAFKIGDNNPQALGNPVESISTCTPSVTSTTANDPRWCRNLNRQQRPENDPHVSAPDAEYLSEATDAYESDLASDVQETSSELDFDQGLTMGNDHIMAKRFLETTWSSRCDCTEQETLQSIGKRLECQTQSVLGHQGSHQVTPKVTIKAWMHLRGKVELASNTPAEGLNDLV